MNRRSLLAAIGGVLSLFATKRTPPSAKYRLMKKFRSDLRAITDERCSKPSWAFTSPRTLNAIKIEMFGGLPVSWLFTLDGVVLRDDNEKAYGMPDGEFLFAWKDGQNWHCPCAVCGRGYGEDSGPPSAAWRAASP